MANPNIETETLTKGVRLTVTVEYSLENIIAVCLTHNGKEFRGILLECDQGLFPHGLPFSNKPMVEQNSSVKASPRSALDIKPGTENKPPDLTSFKDVKVEQSAVGGRFSYNTNPFLINPRPVPEVPTIEMKPVAPRRKTIRDIRLRPRQTLCSKCKSAIHENHKNHSNSQGNSQHTVTRAATKLIPPNKCPLKFGIDPASHSVSVASGLRKRKSSLQTPMVLLEDIQEKYLKSSSEKNSKVSNASRQPPSDCNGRGVTRSNSGNKLSDLSTKKNTSAKARSNRSSSSGSTNCSSSVTGHDRLHISNDCESLKGISVAMRGNKKEKTSVSNSCNPKPSPAIKITIGDGAILKIPPRLPDRETQVMKDHFSVPRVKVLDILPPPDYQPHKKAKKAAKKAKDRDKSKPISCRDTENSTDITTDETLPPRTQKKHKKKHRHRHDSPQQIPVDCIEDMAQKSPEEKKVDEVCIEEVSVTDGKELYTDTDNATSWTQEEKYESTLPVREQLCQTRPRLVYTWKQNHGLSRVAQSPKQSPSMSPNYLIKASPNILPIGNSPHRRKNASPARVVSASPSWHFTTSPNCMLKDYPLRSKSSSTYSSTLSSEAVPPNEYGMIQASEDSQSHSSGVESNLSDFAEDFADERSSDEFFGGGESAAEDEEEVEKGSIKPLMMKIQTQNVSGCILEEGREIRVGDIVWGKIQGFPWWPGRVTNITVTQRDNDVVITQLAKVAWFGSNTMSHMHCSDLFPFLEDFKARYNKKKKGQYRVAIKQATMAAQVLASETEQEFAFEDYEL